MIKVTITNDILNSIIEIELNRYKISLVELSQNVLNKLRKNSKIKSSYASNKIEGNPLSEKQAEEVIESDERKHYLKPEQEVRNYFLALNYLEEKLNNKEKLSKKLILDVQKLVEKGAPKEKIGLRGPMPPGVLFAVYDSKTGNPDYIPPEYSDVPGLLDELIEYVNTTDDHPLIVAAVVHYQLVTIHPFEDGNGRTARLLSGYIMDLNGYGFNGIGSLEEYFAYDVDEYYDSIQMGLPALYYSGRENPPHPEIWINSLMSEYKPYPKGIAHDLKNWSEVYRHTSCKHCGKQYNGWKRQYLCKECIEDDSVQFYPNFIITDTRFENELEAIKKRGGITIRVNRPCNICGGSGYHKMSCPVSKSGEHYSETALDKSEFDYIVDNDSDIESLIEKVKEILIKEKLL